MKLSIRTLLLLPLSGALCASVAQRSAEIPLTRSTTDGVQHKGAAGVLHEFLARSLYWFGKFDVGAAKGLTLLIDTGSPLVVLDPGKYKPSKHSQTVNGTGNIVFTYEGVGRNGFGFETVNTTYIKDQVSGAGGLTVPDQPIFLIQSYKYSGVPDPGYAIQHDGLIGFGGAAHVFHSQAGWFYNLCKATTIAHCRFGLAYGTDGKGMAIIGKVARRLFKGSLVTVPFLDKTFYNLGDVYLDGELFATDQFLIMDEGTNNIQAPISTTKKIFSKLGYSSYEYSVANPYYPPTPPKTAKFLTGYFPCNKPPTLGFAFPPKSALKKGQSSTIFNVSSSVWDASNNGNNNCTSILGGTNFLGINKTADFEPWLLGQPFFQGRYIDFNVAAQEMGYADLKNPEDPTESS